MCRSSHTPDIGKLVAISRMGIRHIEDVAQLCRLLVVVYQGDALCAPVDPAVEPCVPCFKRRAGRGVRTLGIDQKLIREGIPVHAGGRIHKAHPVRRRLADPAGPTPGEKADTVQFCICLTSSAARRTPYSPSSVSSSLSSNSIPSSSYSPSSCLGL